MIKKIKYAIGLAALSASVMPLSLTAATVSTLVDLGLRYNDDIAIDASGNIYISNTGEFINGSGRGTDILLYDGSTLSSFVSDARGPTGIGLDNQDRLYYTNTGDRNLVRLETDGTTTTFNPAGNIEFDSDGVGYIASYPGNSIFRLDLDGTISAQLTNSPELNGPVGLALDSNDNLYFANFNDGNIFRLNNDNSTTLIANGVYGGVGYLTYQAGDLYATAPRSSVVYKISLTGETEIIAGQLNSSGFANGEGSEALFNFPNGIAATPDGLSLLVTEYRGQSQLRKIDIDLPEENFNFTVDDTIQTDEDSSITFNPIDNDVTEGFLPNPETLEITSIPSIGTVEVDLLNGDITYTPSVNANGTESVTYRIRDNQGRLSNNATVTITVNPVNDSPVAVSDSASTVTDTAVSISVLANDEDADEPLDNTHITIGSQPNNGTIEVFASGQVQYSPTMGFEGSDTFTYHLIDSDGLTSNEVSVNISVRPTDDNNDTSSGSGSSGGGSTSWTLLFILGLVYKIRSKK